MYYYSTHLFIIHYIGFLLGQTPRSAIRHDSSLISLFLPTMTTRQKEILQESYWESPEKPDHPAIPIAVIGADSSWSWAM